MSARKPPSRGALAAHRLAVRAVRPLIRPPVASEPGRPRVTILMTYAFGTGGVARAVAGLAEHLATSHDVTIVNLVRQRRNRGVPSPAGVRVLTLDDRKREPRAARLRLLRSALQRLPSRLIHPSDMGSGTTSIWTDIRLLRALRAIRSGVVISTRPSLNILAAELARPGVVTIGQEHRDLGMRDDPTVQSIRRSYGALDALVVLTESDRRRYDELLQGATRVVAIPNAASTLGGARSDLTQPVVIAGGRLRPQKGFDLLIKSFAQQVAPEAADWSLQIFGQGPRRSSLQAMIDRRGLGERVRLRGWTPDMAPEFERASIFALSSRSEGFPLVLLEAMGKGLPVVAYDCPTGPADIVDDGRTGFLIAPGDIDGFGEAILELIRDEPKRRRFGEAAVERAREWDSSSIQARWDELIAELVREDVRNGP